MKHILEFTIALIRKYRSGEELPTHGFFEKRVDGLLNQLDAIYAEHNRFYKIADERWSKHWRVGDITIITPDIAIVDVYEKNELRGYFPIVNGRASSTYSEDKETAILIALGEKYDGLNSRFSEYACKMLGKDLE